MLLENQDDNEKKVTLEIESTGYIIHDKDGSGSYKLFYGLKKVIQDYDAEFRW